MIKYTCGLVASLMISSTIFGGTLHPQVKPLEEAKRTELKKQEQELMAASVLLKKNQGKNGTAVEAAWEQIDALDDIRDDIQDQLRNRDENK
jgi:hypothetical protein